MAAPSSSIFSPRRLAELRLSDEDDTVFLFSYFDDDADDDSEDTEVTLHLKLFVAGDVFCGVCDVSSAALQSAAEEFDVSTEEVRKLTLEALRISDNSQFLYDWRRDGQKGEEGTLVWRRDSEGFGLSQQIGSVTLKHLLKSDAASSMNAAFSFASGAIDDADDRIASLRAETARYEMDRRRAVDRYEKVVAEAKQKEDEMLGKMVLLLNEKKAEIRRLKRKIEATGGTLVKMEEENRKKDGGIEEEWEQPSRKGTLQEAGASISDTQIYEQDTDVDSDSSYHDQPPEEEVITAKKSRVGASSAPVTSASVSASASASKSGSNGQNADAVKSKSFVHNFLRDSSDEEL